MPMIDVQMTPDHATRIFFDCRDAAPGPTDQQRIAQTIERAIALALAEAEKDAALPLAA